MTYTIIAVGKLKEDYYRSACSEYIKRLGAYGGAAVIELPEQRLPSDPSQGQIDAALSKEAELIYAKIPKNAYTVAMCVEGQKLSSPALSKRLYDQMSAGSSAFAFIIGGSYGLDEALKQRADLRLSMSDMTFPHHLARVMLLEQLYRCGQIAQSGKYHK